MSKAKGPKRERKAPFPLRVPPDVEQRAREEARANERSLNREYVFRLRQAYGIT